MTIKGNASNPCLVCIKQKPHNIAESDDLCFSCRKIEVFKKPLKANSFYKGRKNMKKSKKSHSFTS